MQALRHLQGLFLLEARGLVWDSSPNVSFVNILHCFKSERTPVLLFSRLARRTVRVRYAIQDRFRCVGSISVLDLLGGQAVRSHPTGGARQDRFWARPLFSNQR
jgi:hypothetical protein